jgi:hypothetical protein
MSILDTLEDQTLDTVAAVQEAVIALTKTIVERTEPVSKFWPQGPSALPSIISGMFAMAEKQLSLADRIVANQKAFLMGLADAQTSAPPAAKARSRTTVKDAA